MLTLFAVPIATRVAAMLSDLMALAITLAYTVRIRRGAKGSNFRTPVTTLILRSGTSDIEFKPLGVTFSVYISGVTYFM